MRVRNCGSVLEHLQYQMKNRVMRKMTLIGSFGPYWLAPNRRINLVIFRLVYAFSLKNSSKAHQSLLECVHDDSKWIIDSGSRWQKVHRGDGYCDGHIIFMRSLVPRIFWISLHWNQTNFCSNPLLKCNWKIRFHPSSDVTLSNRLFHRSTTGEIGASIILFNINFSEFSAPFPSAKDQLRC